MTSKPSFWQSKWQTDEFEDVLTHDTGLKVRLNNGVGSAENPEEVIETLEQIHGAHNARAMVQRLVREGEQLLIDPNSRGWRGKDRRV